jgi:hypothetical protein
MTAKAKWRPWTPRPVKTQGELEFYKRGLAAQATVDELLEICWCSHVRAGHDAGGACRACTCQRFGKAVG